MSETTKSNEYRWKYLSTIVTIFIVVGYTSILVGEAYGITEPVSGGTWTVFSGCFITVVAYSVGVDTMKKVKEIRKS